MLGTKLLLLSFVVYVSGQGVSYYGGSNVRTQGRPPPRPLKPYRPVYQPSTDQMRPVYPQPNQPQPEQPAPEVQPVYQPPQTEQPATNPQPIQPMQPVNQPSQPVYERPSEPPAPVIPSQPIYQPIPPDPAIPSQPAPWPVDSYPRPLPPWSWKPIQSTEAPVEIITPEATTIEEVNTEPTNVSPPSHNPIAVDTETPAEIFPEGPAVVVQPEATPVSLSNPEDPIPENPQPELTPEPTPETTPQTFLIDAIADPEQPTFYPDPLVPVSSLKPRLKPISNPGYPTPRPFPSTPRPAPVSQPPRPVYKPLPPPTPVNPVELKPQRPLPRQPPTLRPTYEPWPTSTSYPTPVSSLAPVSTQPPPRPTSYPIVPPTSVGPVPGLPDISLVIPMANFECKNGNGYYKIVNECDAYIKCENRQAYKYSCPDGLYFNPEAQYQEYPCAYPSQVQCDSTASKQIPRPTSECPNRYGFFSISGGDCSKYIMCQEGKATLMSCPFGLVFNDKLSSCDWPENVPQCNSNAFNDFTCPAAPEEDPDQLTRYRYGSDCRMYIACQHGYPRLLKCNEGLSFDVNSQFCIDSDLVTECRITNQH